MSTPSSPRRPDRPDEPRGPSIPLDAFLDDQLSPDQAELVQASLDTHLELRDRVELQRRIDASLTRSFSHAPFTIRSGADRSAPLAPPPRPLRLTWLPFAAAIALALGLATYFLALRPPSFPDPSKLRASATPTIFETTYHQIVNAGLVPEVVCTTDDAFRDWMDKQFQTPSIINPKPQALTLVGWSYPKGMPGYVGALLATQSDRPTIVFIQQLSPGATPVPPPHDPALQQHFRQYRGLLLYQLSPKGTPNLLPAFVRG